MRQLCSAVLLVALLACAYVAVWRVHVESQARRVEIAMDYGDLSSFERSYGYREAAFLLALRRAGLTSLAVSEELGGTVDAGKSALLVSGRQLLDQARLSAISEPTLAAWAKARLLRADEVYLLVYDRRELPRYRAALERHFSVASIRVVDRGGAGPVILAVRSQLDYMDALGLGLPSDTVDLARRMGFYLMPRVQNDYRYGTADIDALMGSFKGPRARPPLRVSTVVFFGQRNEILGYPNHLDDTAAAFRRDGYVYGAIETYDRNQVQKGAEGLGRLIPADTTRVEAISKTELDKLDLRTVVARYLLGVRERNVRVVYLRPMLHPDGALSLQQTNVEMVRRIAEGLRAEGFRLGRATPVREAKIPPLVVFVASLAVPAIFLLLLEELGIAARRWAAPAFAADLALLLGGYAVHHDLFARKLIALCGAVLFAIAALVAVADRFVAPAASTFGGNLADGARTVGAALGTALLGALTVVGLLSVPVLMEEIEAFSGVKAVILVPPVAALLLALYARRFRTEPLCVKASLREPVRIYQLAAAGIALAAAALYVMRSGNQSEIAPSSFELALRSGLTTVLGVRPRFKEFLVGVPCMMLLPALTAEHRRAAGWLLAPAVAIGTADVIDTFSHLHTPLEISLLRIINGAAIGLIVGVAAIALYRRSAH